MNDKNHDPDADGERHLFPYNDDQLVIAAFLAGRKIYINKLANLTTHGGVLKLSDAKIAWFDETSGSLVAVLPTGPSTQYSRRVIEHITRAIDPLTSAPRIITRERRDGQSSAWFFGDQLTHIGEPFIVCGPLGVLAYRAGLSK